MTRRPPTSSSFDTRNSAVLEGLATLPTDARAALLMAAQGFTGREIATVLGRSEVATRTMMFRARQKLRLYLVLKGEGG
jgi:DNA-directed RNA polymerase specialized sigma24 family protein